MGGCRLETSAKEFEGGERGTDKGACNGTCHKRGKCVGWESRVEKAIVSDHVYRLRWNCYGAVQKKWKL